MDEYITQMHIVVPAATLVELDDYQFIARRLSRSDTIRYLTHLALNGSFPSAHLHLLNRMRAQQSKRSQKEYKTLLDKYKPTE